MNDIRILNMDYYGEKPNGHYEITVKINEHTYVIYGVNEVDKRAFEKTIKVKNGFSGFNYLKKKYKIENIDEPSDKERDEVLKGFDKLNDMIKKGFKNEKE